MIETLHVTKTLPTGVTTITREIGGYCLRSTQIKAMDVSVFPKPVVIIHNQLEKVTSSCKLRNIVPISSAKIAPWRFSEPDPMSLAFKNKDVKLLSGEHMA